MTRPVGTDNPAAWQLIDTVPLMRAVWLHHPYYSHGQTRLGYRSNIGDWIGVNSDGTEGFLNFAPTHWQDVPEPPDALLLARKEDGNG